MVSAPSRAKRAASRSPTGDDSRAADRSARSAGRPPPPDRRRRRMRARRAPPEAHLAKAALRRRFGVSAQLYALKRDGDQGSATSPRSAAPARCGRGGAAFSASVRYTTYFRTTASEQVPTTLRTDASSIRSSSTRSTPADCLTTKSAPPPSPRSGPDRGRFFRAGRRIFAAWATKREALAARYAAFARARAARPDDSIFVDHDRFVAAGGEALRRFAIFEAIAARRDGEDWRPLARAAARRRSRRGRGGRRRRRNPRRSLSPCSTSGSPDRQLAAAAERAKAGGLEIGFYRDLAVGAAPDGAENWARADELARNVTVGAPPDPFSPLAKSGTCRRPTRSPPRARAGAASRR